MRLALVYRAFNRSASLPRETVELASHLSQRHEVHVFSMGSRTDRSLAPDCRFHDVPVSHIGSGKRFSARELASFARKAAKLISGEQFDVVHTCAPSTWVADVLYVPGIASEEARLQGLPAWRSTAACLYRPGDAVRRIIEHKALTNPSLRRVHLAVPSMQPALTKRYGIPPERVLVVPPAVNLDEFSPPADKHASRADAGIEDQNVLVALFCGSDFERKGLDRAIRAISDARADVLLLVVGNGPEGPYRRLAAERGVTERVRFLGRRSDAWRFYQAADVFVLPTRADVWGITPLEAMACAVPPIVSAAAGSASSIRDGETGIVLAEPFVASALRDAIDALAADPDRRLAMGRAGLAAAQGHSWAARARRVEEDLLAVAGGRSS